MAAEPKKLLDVRDLTVDFSTQEGVVHAVDHISFGMEAGELVGLVGESGCGKSVTASAILGLTRMLNNATVSGEIFFGGRDLLALPEKDVRAVRGHEIAMIFQDPVTSLNPVLSIERLMTEGLELHLKMSHSEAVTRSIELLQQVGIPKADQRIHDYPHQFSGGMRQRVMIAMALACKPRLLIADEPTTALDVTIQAQILDLLTELKERLGMAVLLITHAMGVVAEVAQRVVVMYAGQVIEEGTVEEVFERPWHPYTQGLIRSIPRIDADASRGSRLVSIPGTVPSLLAPPPGCRFAPRCAYARDACTQATPALREVGTGHRVACILEEAPR
jgi:peptide/nickel transport system ATP-binding protein